MRTGASVGARPEGVSRLRKAAALAVCLAIVAAIALVTGTRGDSVPVRYADVVVGETGAATDFDVRVLDVRLTQQVQRDESAEPLGTDATFVVVDLTADARRGTVNLTGDVWLLTASGHRYAPRDEFGSAQPSMVQPGFTTTGTFVFQVPPDRIAGARLLVEPGTALFVIHDTTVRVNLGLGEDAPLLAEPIMLAPSTTEVTP